MVRDIVKDEFFLRLPSEPAGVEDQDVIRDLRDTLAANRDGCVGMAANMIGVRKQIIIVNLGKADMVLLNPKITASSGVFETEEGCLSLTGTRKTKRFRNIEVAYLDTRGIRRKKKFNGWTAQILQHEIDHLSGILI